MEHIFDSLDVSMITDQATLFFSGLTPAVVLVVGILLAFYIITFLVRSMKQATTKNENFSDYPDYQEPERNDDDFDEFFDDDDE